MDGGVGILHGWYCASIRRRLREASLATCIGIVAIWPIATLGTVLYLLWNNGSVIRERTGRGIFAQGGDQLWLVICRGIPPPWYYVFELFRPELSRRAGEYLLRNELKPAGIYSRLRRYSGATGNRTLSDKLQFYHFCRDHGLPAVEVYCEVDTHGVRWQDARRKELPERDAFAKPRALRGGRGAQRWRWRNGVFVDTSGRAFDGAGLLEYLGNLAADHPYLLQECLVNHLAILDFTAGALSTVRVLVCTNEEGNPEIVHSCMRMSCDPKTVVDNVHAGGLAAPVDLGTGRLGRATNLGLSAELGWRDTHPVTGAGILGFKLPHWEETRALASQAHRELHSFIVAGWDIGILADGPVLVEGNHAPCVDSTQRMLSRPIGNDRFGQLLAFHLERAEAGEAPPTFAGWIQPRESLSELVA